MKVYISAFCLFALAVAAVPPAPAQDSIRYRVSVQDNNLRRGNRVFNYRAIQVSRFMHPDTPKSERAKAFVALSGVGATTVWFDLEGFSEDGTNLDPAYTDAFRRAVGEADYTRIGTICRVFGEDASTDKQFRLNAVRTAAKTFAKDFSVLYLIDGPGAQTLVEEFKTLAPRLAVAAARKGDVALVASFEDAKGKSPVLVTGEAPDALGAELNFMLPGTDASYARMDELAAHPGEKIPWTPTSFGLSAEEEKDGWISLFDGKSLDGWIFMGKNHDGFKVVDETIEWAGRGASSLRTHDRYDDFVLRVEFKIGLGGNSGIFLRAPRANRESKIGMEFQIMGDYGKEADIHTTGAVYSVIAPLKNASKPAGEWNSLEIMLHGAHLKATLNGEVVQDLNLDEHEELRYRLRNGFLALQDHGNPVAFRHIRLKKL